MTHIRDEQNNFIPVPDRFEAALKDLDQRGFNVDHRNDGILDVADAPFNQVHEVIWNLTAADAYLPTNEETDFLLNLGINPLATYDAAPDAAAQWRKKAAFFGQVGQGAPYPKIEVILEPAARVNEQGQNIPQDQLDEASAFLHDLLIEIAEANALPIHFLPQKIRIHSNDDTMNHFSTTPLDKSPGNATVLRHCGNYVRIIQANPKALTSAGTVRRAVLSGYLALLSSSEEQFSINLPASFLHLLVDSHQLIKTADAAQARQIRAILKSNLGFPLAHELGHLIEVKTKGAYYLSEAHRQSTAHFTQEKDPLFISAYALAICTNNMGEFLEKTPYKEAYAMYQKMNHRIEMEADYLGVVLSLNAGLDPQYATLSFLDEVPESFSHPAESFTKAAVNVLFAELSKN